MRGLEQSELDLVTEAEADEVNPLLPDPEPACIECGFPGAAEGGLCPDCEDECSCVCLCNAPGGFCRCEPCGACFFRGGRHAE